MQDYYTIIKFFVLITDCYTCTLFYMFNILPLIMKHIAM